MKIRSGRNKGGVVAGISSTEKCIAVVKPGKPADLEDVLTSKEAEQVRKGEAQLRQGLYVTLEQLENDLVHKARKGSRKAV
jgi:hypothetical protein